MTICALYTLKSNKILTFQIIPNINYTIHIIHVYALITNIFGHLVNNRLIISILHNLLKQLNRNTSR